MDWSLVLLSQGIETVIEPAGEDHGWALLVAPQDVERALKNLRQYQTENRGWPWPGYLADERFQFHWGSLGWALALAITFWLSNVISGILAGGVMDSARVVSGQWWRVFTAMLLHADLAHLATNLAIGIVFVGLVMGRYGAGLGLLAAYLAGAGGNVASLILNLKPFHGLGASGMIMGALGILAAQSFASGQPRGKSLKYLFGGTAAGLMLFLLFAVAPGTDMAAHLGGFISGLILGVTLVRAPKRISENPHLHKAAWMLLFALLVFTWLLALIHN